MVSERELRFPRSAENHLLGDNSFTRRTPMKLKIFLLLAVLLILASPVFAADAPGTASPGEWKFALCAIGMGIASGLCGIGQGQAVAGATEGMARHPGAPAPIRGALILRLGPFAQRGP